MEVNHRLTYKGLNFKSEYPLCDIPNDMISDLKAFNIGVDFNDLYKIDILKEWNKIFHIKAPIKYESSTKNSGVTRQYHDGTIKKYPDRNTMVSSQKAKAGKFSESLQILPTGYVIPRYEFIGQRLYRRISHMFENNETEEAYKEALDLVGLEENDEMTVLQYNDVGTYRDILHNQIDRQAKKILNILPSIAYIFKIHYFETEKAITNAKYKSDSNTEVDKLNSDLRMIQDGLVSLFLHDIQSGKHIEKLVLTESDYKEQQEKIGSPDVKRVKPFLLAENAYIPKNIMARTLSSFDSLIIQMKSIRDIAVALARKTEPLESILEDFFMGRKVKSIGEYKRSLNIGLTKYEIYKTAYDLRQDGMPVPLIFEYMQNWLHSELGYDNEELSERFKFRLKDANDFMRTVNQYMTRKKRNN